jgi:hypothetical protein
MAYIPHDAEWYIAELINEITIEGNPGNVVHRNFMLVNASSPEEAYQKALDLGSSSEVTYDNPEGKQVSIHFRGLGDLSVIQDKLEHGAELMYSEELGVSEAELRRQVRSKVELTVFRPTISSFKHPDYRSEEIVRQIERVISRNE